MTRETGRGGAPPGRVHCDDARRLIHERLDDGGPAAAGGPLDEHLAACAACRTLSAEFAEVQASLRALPALRLDDGALAEIWQRTAGAAPPERSGRRWARRALRLAPAAATIALAVAALLVLDGPFGRDPQTSGRSAAAVTDAELERAAEDVRLVLGLTGEALGRSRKALVREVLGGEVGPALRRVPLVGSPPRPAAARGS